MNIIVRRQTNNGTRSEPTSVVTRNKDGYSVEEFKRYFIAEGDLSINDRSVVKICHGCIVPYVLHILCHLHSIIGRSDNCRGNSQSDVFRAIWETPKKSPLTTTSFLPGGAL